MNKDLLKPYKEKAKILGVKNPQYLMQIANGHRKPSGELAQKMSETLGIPLWELRPDIYPEHLFNKEASHE
ncbi:helix-turn-helix transcriptional regulator [Thiomicrorhabdus sp.]|uniref:helix-turn-helix transcriptional regulator n=1 Tax=Thiomicrorhabdus sp. TaxID=2039724 RepID=UPI0029C946AD|nr:helix-turn-helix transcriptional regulator [Thiomicrorhabdus sp.]